MNLLETCVNKKCRVLSIGLDGTLKDHLCSMGICPNATLCVKRYGLFKSSVQIQIGERIVALGKDQARQIEIRVA